MLRKQELPKIIISAVYKSEEDGTWRGFTAPFDVSCTADSQKGAMKKIDKLTELYEDGLKKYGYPKHLVAKELSDEEDKKVFNIVLDSVLADMRKQMQSDFRKFQLDKQEHKFKHGRNLSGTYSLAPSLA